MQKELLAKELRKVKYKAYQQYLKSMDDEDVIEEFAICDCCDELVVDKDDLNAIANCCTDVVDFLDLLEHLLDEKEKHIQNEIDEEDLKFNSEEID